VKIIRKLAILFLIVLLFSAMLRGAIGNPTSNSAIIVQLSQEFDNGVFRGDVSFTSTRDGSNRYYWLDLPDDFENSTSTPLALFFHGYTGDRYDY
jgi:hypothetical protein